MCGISFQPGWLLLTIWEIKSHTSRRHQGWRKACRSDRDSEEGISHHTNHTFQGAYSVSEVWFRLPIFLMNLRRICVVWVISHQLSSEKIQWLLTSHYVLSQPISENSVEMKWDVWKPYWVFREKAGYKLSCLS